MSAEQKQRYIMDLSEIIKEMKEHVRNIMDKRIVAEGQHKPFSPNEVSGAARQFMEKIDNEKLNVARIIAVVERVT